MLAIITCAKENSKRLPGKNYKLLNGKPLIQYTLETMQFVKNNSDEKIRLYTITDSKQCAKISQDAGVSYIWDEMVDKGMDFNRWVHEKIKSDHYVILQPTNPLRNRFKILEWCEFCIKNTVNSAFSVYKKDRKNYEMNGNFFYYYYTQLNRDDLIDENSIIFPDMYFLDIDTAADWEKARQIYENKNNC